MIFSKIIKRLMNFFFFLELNFYKPIDNLIIVTGADRTHQKSLRQFLYNVRRFEPNTRLIAYDLGMDEDFMLELKKEFENVVFETFDYSRYPSYFNINVNAGEYAWKPIIVSDVYQKYKQSVCWMDAGNLIEAPLTKIKRVLQWNGFFSPFSSGCLIDYTHPKTLDALKVESSELKNTYLSGGCVAFNSNSEMAILLLGDWRDSALNRDVFAPVGSNRENHRQDQSVLTVLAYKYHLVRDWPYHRKFDIMFHRDIG